MNKKRALEILQLELKQMDERNEMTPFFHALSFIKEELGKPDREITKRQFKYNEDEKDDILFEELYGKFRNREYIPSFAGTCTKCGESAEKPEFTLCKHHFNLWQESKKERPNYKFLVHIDSPKEVREYYNIGDIYENKGQCPKCRDIIESLNHYDYVKCFCGHSFIDGGSDYMRCNADLINGSVGFNNK